MVAMGVWHSMGRWQQPQEDISVIIIVETIVMAIMIIVMMMMAAVTATS